nr:hypothetical protein [Tanacetum cinerariifolium]
VHYANLKASIDDYYNENIDDRDQTDQLLEVITTVTDVYKGLEVITQFLKDITNSNIQDHAFKQEEASTAWMKSSTNMAWKIGSRISGLERAQNHIKSSMYSLQEDISSIKSMMTKMYNAFRGQSSSAPSSIVTLTFFITRTPINVEGRMLPILIIKNLLLILKGRLILASKKILKNQSNQQMQMLGRGSRKLVKASSIVRPNPDEPVRVEFVINRNTYYLTKQEIQECWDKEEKIKKAKEKARLNAISKTEVIKVVREEATKIVSI